MAGGWGDLFRGGNAARSAVVGGGMIIHAISTFIVVTILPSVVRDIGGLEYFAWATTLYVLGSLLGGAMAGRMLMRLGSRTCYRIALPLFALGAIACATAESMPVLLAGRLVQGLAAGVLSALSFSLVRVLFPQTLWPRAMSVVSAAWGIATLAGPAVGGVFAQYGAWRAAFWMVAALTPPLLVLVESALPRGLGPSTTARPPMAWFNLAVLACAVLAVSWGGRGGTVAAGALGLAVALACLAVFVLLEARGNPRLLPSGACRPSTGLGAVFAVMAGLLIGMTTEIFVAYFLQTLHGVAPIYAGYLTAFASAGWTFGSVTFSGATGAAALRALRAGPLVMLGGLLLLLLAIPGGGGGWVLLPVAVALTAVGIGIGLCWPHVSTRVLTLAPEGEKDLAAASITVVTMLSNAFGCAIGGLVTNLAGLTGPGGPKGAASAAFWLFLVFLAGPLLSYWAVRRVVRAG